MRRKTVVLATVILFATATWMSSPDDERSQPRRPKVVVGNPDVLQARYEAWKAEFRDQAEYGVFALGLSAPRAMDGALQGAGGVARIDLVDGSLEAELSGVSGEEQYDLWLVGGHEGSSLRPSPDAPRLLAGRFEASGERLRLETDLCDRLEGSFAVDLAIVVPAGGDPAVDGVLFGMPNLFQRLLAEEQRLARAAHEQSLASSLSLALLGPLQSGGVPTGFPNVFSDLVAQGEDLFFNGTFAGNGRTCGTCHPANANFTLNADDIARLPVTDPLFVAEFDPNLQTSGNFRFENPVLMRTFGLILENVDGFDFTVPDRFAMRGIPHTLGLSKSLQRPDAATDSFLQRTGWSGDGAPTGQVGDLKTNGTLLDFAVGAVIQHFTKTFNRTIGTDFRLPFTDELIAMEAFQLSLGRTEDLSLATMSLKDADADTGRRLFLLGPNLAGGSQLVCNACHGNAGALDSAVPAVRNANFNTGIELFLVNHPDPTGEPRPRDGGFGATPVNADGSRGNRTFNTPSVIESADTPPFFHNNVIDTLEGTITFYNTAEFKASFFGLSIPFNATEVAQVAAFMRVINTLDNLDNAAVRSATKAIDALNASTLDNDVINRLLQLAISDIDDCDEVLTEGNLHNDVRQELRHAKQRFNQAQNTHKPVFVRIEKIKDGLGRIDSARALMIN